MTVREVYHYPTQHYDHHLRQLTLADTTTAGQNRRLPEATSGEEVPRILS
jgi:hypothetical protein